MHIKFTQEMREKITEYSISLIIAILFFSLLNHIPDLFKSFKKLLSILLPFLLGLGIAFILNNPEKWIETKVLKNAHFKEKTKKLIATLTVFILTISFLVLVFSIIIPNTLDSIRQFSKNFSSPFVIKK